MKTKKIIRILLLIMTLSPVYLFAQEKGVHFEQGLTWKQVQEKANKEGKAIFVDAYATWCGPCKQMDADVYPDEGLGEFFNKLFISVKVQMDTTKNDSEFTKSWYLTAHDIMVNNKVTAFPTFLFFSSDGTILHRETGYENPMNFLQAGLSVRDRDKREYALLAQYKAGNLLVTAWPNLIPLLKKAGETNAANEITQRYVNEYVLKLPDELLYTKQNLTLLGGSMARSTDPSFKLLYQNAKKVDKIVSTGYAEGMITAVIDKEEINPRLWSDEKREKPLVTTPDWEALHDAVEKKYDRTYADLAMEDPQINWYKQHKQWNDYLKVEVNKYSRICLDSVGHIKKNRIDDVNNFVFDYVIPHGTDKKLLKTYLNWQKQIIEIVPDDPDLMDTYANLLYKVGQKAEAIATEQKAILFKEKDFEQRRKSILNDKAISDKGAFLAPLIKRQESDEAALRTTLLKIKNNEPTWKTDN